jgi:hypothetical protein
LSALSAAHGLLEQSGSQNNSSIYRREAYFFEFVLSVTWSARIGTIFPLHSGDPNALLLSGSQQQQQQLYL